MKRVIKFRGKGLYTDKWIAGYYFVNRGDHFIAPDEFVNPLAGWTDYQVDPDTIGEFTGLQGKNGRDIYEGDMLEGIGGRVWIVEFCQGGFITTSEGERGGFYIVHAYPNKTMQVIGNIHDNPEIIK